MKIFKAFNFCMILCSVYFKKDLSSRKISLLAIIWDFYRLLFDLQFLMVRTIILHELKQDTLDTMVKEPVNDAWRSGNRNNMNTYIMFFSKVDKNMSYFYQIFQIIMNKIIDFSFSMILIKFIIGILIVKLVSSYF